MELLKLALDADLLLFVLGIFWLDIVGYIQRHVASCNPKKFGLVLAIIVYISIKFTVS